MFSVLMPRNQIYKGYLRCVIWMESDSDNKRLLVEEYTQREVEKEISFLYSCLVIRSTKDIYDVWFEWQVIMIIDAC